MTLHFEGCDVSVTHRFSDVLTASRFEGSDISLLDIMTASHWEGSDVSIGASVLDILTALRFNGYIIRHLIPNFLWRLWPLLTLVQR